MTALAVPSHAGELKVQKRFNVDIASASSPALTQRAAIRLQETPLLAVGAVDSQGRPWSTVWGGDPGFGQPLGSSMIGITVPVDRENDPVVEALCGNQADNTIQMAQGSGKMMSALTIDLDNRNRWKLFGRLMAGSLSSNEDTGESTVTGKVQLVARIDQCLGNCPKYLNRKTITSAASRPQLVSDSPQLTSDAINLIHKADLFFVSSANADQDMDTNHRGGPAGFTRVTTRANGQSEIVWPEYSGNRLYQTLGNFEITPKAGLVFPDFDTGDVLFVTGDTEILFGTDANTVIPHSNLAVRVTVTAARFIKSSLPFRGIPIESSPYNPKVRPLASEAKDVVADTIAANTATLLDQTVITPTISRFRFAMENRGSYKPGQWVAFDFSKEMDMGYSHMRDDDPKSLNDDFVRTFTVSSAPAIDGDGSEDHFEVTIRRVGSVTGFMFRHQGRHGLEIPLKGFGGDFVVAQSEQDVTPFVAGGVGITPVLAALPGLDMKRFRLFWTLHADDVKLARDVLERHPALGKSLDLFLTGFKDGDKIKEDIRAIRDSGARVETRRLQKSDLALDGLSNTWYICVGTSLRNTLLEMLEGKNVVYEDFNF